MEYDIDVVKEFFDVYEQKISFGKAKCTVVLETVYEAPTAVRLIAWRKGVDPSNEPTVGQQMLAEVRTNETGNASDERMSCHEG